MRTSLPAVVAATALAAFVACAPAAHDAADELRRWLEAHLEACDHLSRAAVARDGADLAQAIQCLASTASYAQCFNTARDRLVRCLVRPATSAN